MTMSITSILGWIAIAGAVFHTVRMWMLDFRMQAFRRPDAPRSAFTLVPMRWQRRYYRPEAEPLIRQAWQAVAFMYAFGVVGAVLIAHG